MKDYPKNHRAFVIFHHSDADGYTAAAVMYQALTMQTDFTDMAVTIPSTYGDDFSVLPKVRNLMGFKDESDEEIKEFSKEHVTVMFLDLSFTEDTMHWISKACGCAKHVLWVDHHAGSIEANDKIVLDIVTNPNGEYANLTPVFDTRACGALLAYIHCKMCEAIGGGAMYDMMLDINEVINANKSYSGGPVLNITADHVETYLVATIVPDGRMSSNASLISITIPSFLYYIDAHDRWDKHRNDIDKFSLGLMSYNEDGYKRPQTNDVYRCLNTIGQSDIVDEILKIGDAVSRYDYNICMIQNRLIRKANLWDHHVYLKNMQGNSNTFRSRDHSDGSDFTDRRPIYERDPKSPMAIWGSYYPEQKAWTYTIAMSPDAAQVAHLFAKCVGGGGHPGCSGFTIKECLFEMSDEELKCWMLMNINHEIINQIFGTNFTGEAKAENDKAIEESEEEAFKDKKVWVDGTYCINFDRTRDYRYIMLKAFGDDVASPYIDDKSPIINSSKPDRAIIGLIDGRMRNIHEHIFVIYPNEHFSTEMIGRLYQSLKDPKTNTIVIFVDSFEDNDKGIITLDSVDGKASLIPMLYESIKALVNSEEYKDFHNTLYKCNEDTMFFNLGMETSTIVKRIKAQDKK